MGFLDNKGVKKLVNWVNDKINNISIPETGQPQWSVITRIDNYINLIPYEIYNFYTYTDHIDIRFENDLLPFENKEYKLRTFGHLLNIVNWPSKFDMHWPNNEIPIFEENKKYEIYIAGGRVVSIDDISEVEEVTYIFNTSSEDEITIFLSSLPFTYYVNDEEYTAIKPNNTIYLPSGENIVKIKGCFDDFYIYQNMSDYTLTLDCSKMKSNNFHKVTVGLKIDEIIYPQACFGKINEPVYDFDANEVNLDFLDRNVLYNPQFSFKTNNLILNKWLTYSNSRNIFYNSKLTNKQINKILMSSASIKLDTYDSFCGADVLNKALTLGTVYNGIYITNYNESLESNLFGRFASIIMTRAPYVPYPIVFDEAIIDCDNLDNLNLDCNPFLSQRAIVLIKNFRPSISINARYNDCDFYSYEELPQSVKDDNPGCTFTVIKDISEIPFKYAPVTWDDIKNYDENGNVID